jgi:hypothetical protein
VVLGQPPEDLDASGVDADFLLGFAQRRALGRAVLVAAAPAGKADLPAWSARWRVRCVKTTVGSRG